MKSLAYLTEFCWVANASIACYIAALYVGAGASDPAARAAATRVVFAFGAGPLGTSVVMLGNSLVPHSIDHMMSLLIHLQPAITAYCIRRVPPRVPASVRSGLDLRWRRRWKAVDRELFPLDESASFAAYVGPPLAFLGVWAVFHAIFMLLVGLGLPARGWDTTYFYNVTKSPAATKVLGKIGDGRSEVARFLKYEVASVLLNAVGISLTYLLYAYGTKTAHWGILLAICSTSAWNGAGWYHYRITKFSKELDKLIAAAKPKGD